MFCFGFFLYFSGSALTVSAIFSLWHLQFSGVFHTTSTFSNSQQQHFCFTLGGPVWGLHVHFVSFSAGRACSGRSRQCRAMASFWPAAANMGNSVQPSNDCADDISSIPISDWQLISDQSVDPQFPQRFESGPRQPPSLTISQRPAPTVSHPGMIQSLPMVSQAKCKPAMPPVFSASSQPCSLQFTSRAMTTCKPNPLVYTHHPPAPGEKRLKTQHDRSGTTAVTSLVRTKTPSNIPFLVNLWVSILTALGTLSKVFTDIGNHANFNQMASIILDSFAASTLHRYLSSISKFFTWCRDMDIPLASISVSTVLDVLQGGSKNSGMKGSTILKSLQWCRKQADIANWVFLDSPLI